MRLGLGVGIMASMAHTPADKDLVAIDAGHLFRASMTQIAFNTVLSYATICMTLLNFSLHT